jgi:HSP20 family protein
VEIAGMREDGFSIELDGRHLIIRGTRQDVTEKSAYHQMEIRFGDFIIDFELPTHVNTDEVEAVYKNGFLVIQLPKARPRQIPIVK